jgi:conjugative transfer signal peptidase TraF
MTRFGAVTTTCFALLAIGGPAIVPPAPRLIWNATASTPIGLYALRPIGRLHAMELLAVRPPEPIANFLSRGGFLPKGAPLLKHVMGLPGQTVCRTGDAITVDGIAAGDARDRDHLGRPLPNWSGCRTLQPGEVFLMNPAVPDSLDGRYFGPLPSTSIAARAVPLWTDEDDDGRFVWRAATDLNPALNPPTREAFHGANRSVHPR